MPVKELTTLLEPEDRRIAGIAGNLPYRDFMTAGLIVKRMRGARGGARRTACRLTTGSTCRSPMSSWAACRYSTTGARRWLQTPTPSGSDSSTSVRTATSSGRCRMARFVDFASGELAKSG